MVNPSKEPASRLDVTSLQEQLDKKLNERKARESGICYVREELYGQCMDEMIRHVTLEGPERGLLLRRARDKIRMTIDAYKTLFKSSVNFGIKKKTSLQSTAFLSWRRRSRSSRERRPLWTNPSSTGKSNATFTFEQNKSPASQWDLCLNLPSTIRKILAIK